MAMPMQDPTGGSPAPQSKPDPKQIEAQLIQVLQQAAKLAEQNGIDFKGLLMKVMGGGAGNSPDSPPSAVPSAPKMPTSYPGS